MTTPTQELTSSSTPPPSTFLVTQSPSASTTLTSTQTSRPQIYPAAATPSGQPPPHDSSVFNYYFLFLAAFGVLVAALLWWFHLQRKRRKDAQRVSGQHALARDLEGWAGARRFMHGRYGRYQTSARVRREEGLDENGEAPPPYQPKNEIDVDVDVVGGTSGEHPAIPLRAVVRDSEGRRPPGYSTDART